MSEACAGRSAPDFFCHLLDLETQIADLEDLLKALWVLDEALPDGQEATAIRAVHNAANNKVGAVIATLEAVYAARKGAA